MEKLPPCFYRVSVKALVVKDGKVLLGQESDGRWELPGGGLEVGEDFKSGLQREIKEELDVEIKRMSDRPMYVWTAQYVEDDITTPALLLGFPVELVLDINKKNGEYIAMKFFDQNKLQKINLHPSVKPFASLYNPDDFTKL